VAPFGVNVCTLEPGGIQTNWARRAGQNATDLLPDYEPRSVRCSSCSEASKDVFRPPDLGEIKMTRV
jgi:hypothetical protein